MKKVSVLLTSILIFSLIVFLFSSTATTQPPGYLTGIWEVSFAIVGDGWDGEKFVETGKIEGVVICHYDFEDDYTSPNLYVAFPDDPPPIDPFYGVAQGGQFALYKENCDNCGGPSVNLGREMIIGYINDDGNILRGKGVGFDSLDDCGGIWSYPFIAKRTGVADFDDCPVPRPTDASCQP